MVNTTMANILGYDKSEIIGESLFDFIQEKNRAAMKKHLKKRKRGIKEVYDFEFLTKSGDPVITRLRASPLFDEDGNYKGSMGFVSKNGKKDKK